MYAKNFIFHHINFKFTKVQQIVQLYIHYYKRREKQVHEMKCDAQKETRYKIKNKILLPYFIALSFKEL